MHRPIEVAASSLQPRAFGQNKEARALIFQNRLLRTGSFLPRSSTWRTSRLCGDFGILSGKNLGTVPEFSQTNPAIAQDWRTPAANPKLKPEEAQCQRMKTKRVGPLIRTLSMGSQVCKPRGVQLGGSCQGHECSLLNAAALVPETRGPRCPDNRKNPTCDASSDPEEKALGRNAASSQQPRRPVY